MSWPDASVVFDLNYLNDFGPSGAMPNPASHDGEPIPVSPAGLALGRELDIDVTQRCCCGCAWIQHDPSGCASGARDGCRGFHRPDDHPNLHRALDARRAP